MSAATGNRARTAGVYLETGGTSPLRVGCLLRDAKGNVRFIVDEAYIDLGPQRPVLSSRWSAPGREEDAVSRLRDTSDKLAGNGFLPPWFAGLLPEGVLRHLVEARLGTGRHDDFDVLERLGGDLPGAVVVRPEDAPAPAPLCVPVPAVSGKASARAPTDAAIPIRFSLAGIQLKFSMLAADDKITFPAADQNGDVIVKLPNSHYRAMPETEYSGMKLAAAAGVTVADCRLVRTADIDVLPASWRDVGPYALAVRRFDRQGNRRLHMEDLAQILGAVGDRKYTMANEETILNVIRRFCTDPTGSVLEAVRRITVNVLLGNVDAHLKNWSLLYRDPVFPSLSPAYDILPVYVYTRDPDMALRFGAIRRADAISLRQFERAASLIRFPPETLVTEVRTTIERAADLWPSLLKELPLPGDFADLLRNRWETLALTRGL